MATSEWVPAMRQPTALVWDERLPVEDRETIAKLNVALQTLDGLRAMEINVVGPFARSKIAWKLATYQHALLHRIVALIDGVALGFNHQNTLAAALAARALMESFAVFAELTSQTQSLLATKDLVGLDRLAQNGLFATRDKEFLQVYPPAVASNVLGYIDKFDRTADGYRGHYDRLSELCHPNAAGHTHLFSKLNRSDGTVRYAEDANSARHAHMIIAAVVAVLLVEKMMGQLDATILDVAEYHHLVAPVPGP
jgi:hypothetical protein